MSQDSSTITPKIIADILGDISMQGAYKAFKKEEINILETKTGRKKITPS